LQKREYRCWSATAFQHPCCTLILMNMYMQTAMPGSKWDVGVRSHILQLYAEGGLRSLWSGLGRILDDML
jgi:hypothetical protein